MLISKEYASRFTKQLQSFIENNTPSKPSPWIGTIINHSSNLQYCDVQTKKGVLQQIPTFGIPAVGTTAIILFIDDSYSQPVAICNPVNVLDDEKMREWVGQFANNYHSNGDFTQEDEGYDGDFLIDDSIMSGTVNVSIEFDGYFLNNEERPNPKRCDDKYIIELNVLEKKPYGAIPLQSIIKTVNQTPLANKRVTYYIFGEKYYAHTDDNGVAVYNYYPRQGFTEEGYFAVLPQKDSAITFDCALEPGEKDYFKVQMYYQSKDSTLSILVKDKVTGDIIKSVPESLAGDKALWKANGDTWLVNRETYPRDQHQIINVTIANEGNKPIRLDGILVHDESAKYAYYKSKKDLINDK